MTGQHAGVLICFLAISAAATEAERVCEGQVSECPAAATEYARIEPQAVSLLQSTFLLHPHQQEAVVTEKKVSLPSTDFADLEDPDPSTDDLMAAAFKDAFDKEDRRRFYELHEVFAKVTRRSNVSYSLFYGSLFGQYCVGDQLAFDDDSDVAVYDGWERLLNLADGLDQYLLDEYKGKYRLVRDPRFGKTNMKFYSMEGKQKIGRQNMPWLAPFIDVWHLPCLELTCSHLPSKRHDVSTSIIMSRSGIHMDPDNTAYHRHDIFPLRMATFGPLTVPIPKRPKELLFARYNIVPCTKALPVDHDHMMEMKRPPAAIEPFKGGIPFKLASRRLSDSVCAQTYSAELPTISLQRRYIYAAAANSSAETGYARLLNREICKELHSIEVDNSISKVPSSGGGSAATQDIKAMFFNMQWRAHWTESLDQLRGAHIIMLNGVDVGMARTGNINVARQLALKLGKNYVQAVEFVDLPHELQGENRSTANMTNEKGFQCNAILSDFPLRHTSIVRLPRSKTEMHLGSRMVLISNVIVGNRAVWIAVTHLDGRVEEFDASIKALSRDYTSGPMIFAGELHGQMYAVQRRFNTTGLSFDANSAAVSKLTYGDAVPIGDGKVISQGSDYTHLLGARDVKISDMDIQAPVGPQGELLSNSAVVGFRVRLPSNSNLKHAEP